MLSYVIITPARNEEGHIENLINCVITQTTLPLKWVIVSDGSTDHTEEIVNKYSANNNWIELVSRPPHIHRDFASKVQSFNEGYERVKSLDFDIIGNVDADLTFDDDYIEYLLKKFSLNNNLGVAGTPFVEESSIVYDYRYTNIEHVSGGCQFFRRKCFEAVGGFLPVKDGGEDWIAVTTARMLGWQTRTFLGKQFIHYRKLGQAHSTWFKARFTRGRIDYLLGNHPIWEFLRILYQCRDKPYIVGGVTLFLGYIKALIFQEKRPISNDLMAFNRKEQLLRIWSTIKRLSGRIFLPKQSKSVDS